MASILDLPTEILMSILEIVMEETGLKDILSARQSCHLLHVLTGSFHVRFTLPSNKLVVILSATHPTIESARF